MACAGRGDAAVEAAAELRQLFQAWLALQLREDRATYTYPVHCMSLAEQVCGLSAPPCC